MLRRGPGDALGPRFGEEARTWGDALRYRIGRQGKQNGQPFPEWGSEVIPSMDAPGTYRPSSDTIGLSGALRR